VVAVLWARIRLSGLPLERDEGEYAYAGHLLLHGTPPYKLAYSMKFPGTAAAYALMMSVFGESIHGVHIGLIAISLASVGLIFLLGRELLGEVGGIAAAAAYSVLSLMPHVLGQAAHATHFVVLFAIAGALLLIRTLARTSDPGRGKPSPLLIFASGLLFGLALLMKQPGLFFVLFGSIYLISCDWRAQLDRRKIFIRNLFFISGAALPCLLTGLGLWSAGVFEKFWFWTIKYAGEYGSEVSFCGFLLVISGTAWERRGRFGGWRRSD
jgi:4-amino-4-deoxy-L-arabinose transferase-like glycosyltransferase